MARRSIDELLAEARSSLDRLTPSRAWQAMSEGAILVDSRGADVLQVRGRVPLARLRDYLESIWDQALDRFVAAAAGSSGVNSTRASSRMEAEVQTTLMRSIARSVTVPRPPEQAFRILTEEIARLHHWLAVHPRFSLLGSGSLWVVSPLGPTCDCPPSMRALAHLVHAGRGRGASVPGYVQRGQLPLQRVPSLSGET